jgi:hypothetical protein
VALGQRPDKIGSRPSANGRDMDNHKHVSTWFADLRPATADRSEPRGLTQKFGFRKEPNGPAMRPITPLAVENGVGEPATFS